MKFLITLLLSAGIILTFTESFGQYVPGAMGYHEQALMFSNINYAGSARIQGLGNTQVSLGGDVSSALSNPAGLGFYNRSEISITPSYNIYSTNSTYISNVTEASQGNFNIANFGAVFNRSKDDVIPGNWRGGSFAISYSKINAFNSEINYAGLNQNNDILDYYVQDANKQNVDFEELEGITYGAFVSYLMSEFLDAYVNGGDTTYAPFYDRTFFSEFPTERYPTRQEEIISSSGGQNQWNFSYGGNYGDYLYFGATLGIQSIRYNIVKQYSETYPGLSGDIVSSSILTEDLLTEGIGVNGTFGVIARPIKQITIGLSLITPTYLSMSERYYYSSEGNFNNFSMTNYGDYFDANYDIIATNPSADFTTFYEFDANLNKEIYDEESLFDYTITTPMHLNVGTTFFISKNGFISADIEFIDYSAMKIKDSEGLLQNENSFVKEMYKSVVNFSVGGEWRMKAFRLRAGYNYQPSPYLTEDFSSKIQSYSAGLGYRTGKFFVDLAATYKQFNSTYAPYLLENLNNDSYLETSYVDIQNSNLNFALSVGLFF